MARFHVWPMVGLFMCLVRSPVSADFECLCNYAVERPVYNSPDTSSTKLGYMYEFDCKATEPAPGLDSTFKAIAFEHQLGYIEMSGDAEVQICSGEKSLADIITTTLSTLKTTTLPPTSTTSIARQTTPTTTSSSTTTSTMTTTATTTSTTTTLPTTTTITSTTTPSPTTTTTTQTTTPMTTPTITTATTTPFTTTTQTTTPITTTTTSTTTTPTPTTSTTPTTTTTTTSATSTTPTTTSTTTTTTSTTPKPTITTTLRTTTTTIQTTPPPVTWPYGTYALIEPATKCPGHFWKYGTRRFDTEDTSSHNYFSANIQYYLAGSFRSDDITIGFCTKLSASSGSGPRRDWQRGNYCILKKGTCPRGFYDGYIYWDDDDLGNHNSAGGVLPDGVYNKNTKIYFCCRSDGSVNNPIELPRDSPFILLRYRGGCQAVRGMRALELVARWDDEDLFNKDTVGGAHPFDDGGSDDHKLHFCHYRKIQASIIG